MISSDIPDWSREQKPFFAWQPSKSLLASIRCYQKYNSSLLPWFLLLKIVAVVQHRFWSVITGADIPLNCNIAGGLLIPHPNGIVIHPNAKVGPNCLIFQQVTIGSRAGTKAPTIAGHVDIGAGAKILGDITIGAHAQIGANAVVLINVPDGQIAVGIPAKIISKSISKSI